MKETDPSLLGKRIKEKRKEKNMSQEALAKEAEISTTQLSAYENGNRNIGLYTLAKIANSLGCTIDELYFGSKAEKPISLSNNRGELIVNCVTALFDEGIIRESIMNYHNQREYEEMGDVHGYNLSIRLFTFIIEELIESLENYENNKENYSDANLFKKQIMISIANKINKSLGK